jgi:nucleoside 2-deoxyribosyltransferase|tara:strand:- start:189 stop:653 length:465 start_codon:yes stop_codon:yes gene_type:complete
MKDMSKIYTIGSLRNEKVPLIANALRDAGHEVFDDWYAAGPEADDYWQAYETARGHNYKQALDGYAAKDVYNFDKHHLDRNDVVVLVLPAGKSGHLEFGYSIGKGKKGYILFDDDVENCRWDVMYQFADGVFFKLDELIHQLQKDEKKKFKLVS